MLDQWMGKQIHPPLNFIAANFFPKLISANMVTLLGFLIGLCSVPLIWQKYYLPALGVITLNRFMDGLDGAVARRDGVSDLGGYLDITCDFIFYSSVVFGFCLANPTRNSLAGAFLIFSFIGTGTSFLAYSVLAAKRGLTSQEHGSKTFFYLGGLTEGTETIIFFMLLCLLPEHFPEFAMIFGLFCWLTTFGRIGTAIQTFRA